MAMNRDGDFYEEDEPIDEVLAAFDAGEEHVTTPPPVFRYTFVEVSANTAPGLGTAPVQAPSISAPVLGWASDDREAAASA